MSRIYTRTAKMLAVATTTAIALSACGGGSVDEAAADKEKKVEAAGGTCGEYKIIVNPWVGYQADAYVLGHVAEETLGCSVEYVNLKEGGPSYQALKSGDGDVILEEWSHAEDLQKAVDEGYAQEATPSGAIGIIGWYVPGWLAEEHPDILEYENLNKYASDFATSESGGKGQFLGADPTFTQYDEAIVKNLDLDFQVVFSGGENASVEAFTKAQENKEWLIGYFYEPQYVHAEIDLERVALPPYTEGCDADKAAVACDYAETEIKKVVRTEFAESDSPAAALTDAFVWTNDDQNQVAAYITADGMSPEEAAAKWVEENQDKVDAWLS